MLYVFKKFNFLIFLKKSFINGENFQVLNDTVLIAKIHLNFNSSSAFHQTYGRKFIKTSEGTKKIRQTFDQMFATYCSCTVEEV
jgi:hypothetical protein